MHLLEALKLFAKENGGPLGSMGSPPVNRLEDVIDQVIHFSRRHGLGVLPVRVGRAVHDAGPRLSLILSLCARKQSFKRPHVIRMDFRKVA
jgi:hypothetical protein